MPWRAPPCVCRGRRISPLKMVIFHSYVSLPEGNLLRSMEKGTKKIRMICFGQVSKIHHDLKRKNHTL